jgi:hypothetical protein
MCSTASLPRSSQPGRSQQRYRAPILRSGVAVRKYVRITATNIAALECSTESPFTVVPIFCSPVYRTLRRGVPTIKSKPLQKKSYSLDRSDEVLDYPANSTPQ